MRGLTILLVVLASAAPGWAQVEASGRSWLVKPDFEKDSDARKNISGAACVFPAAHCLAVNDEKKYAQFFDIGRSRLRPGQIIRLQHDRIDGEAMKEIDAEGAAYAPPATVGAPAYMYVTGSHGLTRKHGEFNASAFHLFRFPVDSATGEPTFSFGYDLVAPEIKPTTQLRETLRAQIELAPYIERRLDQCGVTIEGLAAIRGELMFGLRAPSVDSHAFILRVKETDLFKGAPPPGRLSSLRLGHGVGVRDLAAVSDGLLILAGRSLDSEPSSAGLPDCKSQTGVPAPGIWFWSGRDNEAATLLGNLPGVDPEMKAETLIVLEDQTTRFRVLVLFDGEKNGEPMEFVIRR